MVDRARQALYLQALQPIAETTADPNSSGFRPQRRGADAIDQCCNVLRQDPSATWILEGDSQGFFDNSTFSWVEAHVPMHKQGLSRWLRSGCIDHGALSPPTAGVPQGGILLPVVRNMVLDGLEAVGQGGTWHRRLHNINDVRWADDFIVTAKTREVLEDVILPRINAFFAEGGVWLSTTKTIITPITAGFDFFGQPLRKYAHPHGKPAKLQITPSTASFQGIKAKGKTLCKQAAGATPAWLIAQLNPVLRGWAHSHRHVICAETCAKLDSSVWQRMYRWAKHRHPDTTGRGITERYVPHQRGEAWRFTAPTRGKQRIRGQETVTSQRHIKIKGEAHPFDLQWEAYFHHRDRQLARKTSSAFRAKILQQQKGLWPICREVIQREEDRELHHRDGNHQHNRRANLVLLPPNCHRQVH
jgi:RNA-directed DNA polymerase